jgi:AcrR family transcriptional regulator
MANARGQGDLLRARLVEAASAMLVEPQAIALPSLRAVARACDVSPAAVYLHFDSQVALIDAVIDDQLARLGAAVASRDAGGAPDGRLTALGLGYVEWGLGHPGAYQLLFESADRLGARGPHDEGEVRWDLIRAAAGFVAEWLDVPSDRARALAFQVWAGLHGIVSLRLHKPDLDWPTPVSDEVAALIATIPRRAG